tara:strand:- start:344 stop:1717 length:1374 start_codon:yes stop_codon:yes gene_type:complete
MNSFVYRSNFKDPVEDIFDWHMRPGALERLIPPWEHVEIKKKSGPPSERGEVHLRMKKNGIPFDMKVAHTGFLEKQFFEDQQLQGPFKHWRHTHRFERDLEGGTVMEDYIEWSSPLGFLGNLFSREFIKKDLNRTFSFRHQRLKNEIARLQSNRTARPLTIAVTGSNGLIGRPLCNVLTTVGHRVIRLVRDPAAITPGCCYWDPSSGEIEAEKLEDLDAVVNLAGEPLTGLQWTANKKQEIWNSRVKGTEILARCLAGLEKPPEVFVSASAIGFYGDGGLDGITEDDGPGDGFLAELCKAWEDAAIPARDKGIRVVHPRIGIVLTPSGGALKQMLLAFQLGAGARFGKGRRFMSWIDHDDLLSLLLFCIVHDNMEGPVNATAPAPVSNDNFSRILGKILKRPVIFSIPDLIIETALGEMGTEMLLSSAKVIPQIMEDRGFEFRYPKLEESLAFQLGK